MDGFTALADPTRRRILELLADGRKDAGTIGKQFTISRPAVSRHLKVLRESGVVNVEVDAQRRIYSVRAEGLAEIDAWLSRYRRFWGERLDALERVGKEDD